MSKNRAIGSEKLTDPTERMARIREMAGIKPTLVQEDTTYNQPLATCHHSVTAVDGNTYGIVQEGKYVYLKKLVDGKYEYLSGVQNLREHSHGTFAEALKHLNLMVKDINVLHGNDQGTDILKKK